MIKSIAFINMLSYNRENIKNVDFWGSMYFPCPYVFLLHVNTITFIIVYIN